MPGKLDFNEYLSTSIPSVCNFQLRIVTRFSIDIQVLIIGAWLPWARFWATIIPKQVSEPLT